MERCKASEEGEQARDEIVNDVKRQILCDVVDVRMRLAEYFEQVLNVEEAVNEIKSDKASGLHRFLVEC